MDADRFSKRRKELGYTMTYVAEKVGVNPTTIARWEKGDIANMRRDKINAYAQVLKVSPLWVMGIETKSTADSFFADVRAYNESANGDLVEYKKRLLSTFVDSIAVSNETIVIYYKLPIPGFNSSEERFVRNYNHALTYFTIRTEFPISAIATLDFRAISCSLQQMARS